MTAPKFDRRQMLKGAATLAAAYHLARGSALAASALPDGIALAPEQPFSWDTLKDAANALAASPWQPAAQIAGNVLEKIDYDAYQHIRYRQNMSLQLARDGRLPVQLFSLGTMFREPVKVHLVEDGAAREVLYRESLFSIPPDHPARELPDDIGFAGFRVMSPDLETDWLAFLGASYFRTSGPYNQYGHFGARPCRRYGPADARGVSALQRILARARPARRLAGNDLRPARQPQRRGRLPDPGPADQGRARRLPHRDGDRGRPYGAPRHHAARRRALLEHVLVWGGEPHARL